MVVWVIVFEGEVFVLEVEDGFHVGVDTHPRQGARLTGELQAGLLQMVEVEVSIACGVDEVAGTESCDLCHHHKQETVGGDVEGYAEEGVCTALVELEAESAVGYVELEQDVAGGEVHVTQVGHVPCGNNQSTAVGIVLNLVDDIGNLVDVSAVVVGPAAPLIAVDMSEVAIGVGPFVPDADASFLQPLGVGIAAQEPKEFVDDTLQVELFSGEEGESVVEVKAHLIAKHADGSRASTVGFLCSFGKDTIE